MNSQPTRVPRATSGFTLLEMIVVVLILGILSVVAAARMFDKRGFDTLGFYDQTMAVVRFAQKVAIAQRTPVRVTLAAGSVQACYGSASCTSSLIDPTKNAPLSAAAPSGVALAPATAFYFDGLGRPSFAGQLTVTVTGDLVRTFYVEAETGYVHP